MKNLLHFDDAAIRMDSSHQTSAKFEGMQKMAESKSVLTGTEMADLIGADPKDFRRFLRSVTDKANQPGSGRRYALTASESDAWAEMYASHSKRAGRAPVSIADVRTDDSSNDA
jgi:hypothetical protein